MNKTILVPTDFSSGSATALGFAEKLARDDGAELLLVHVKPGGVLPPGDNDEFEDKDARRNELRV